MKSFLRRLAVTVGLAVVLGSTARAQPFAQIGSVPTGASAAIAPNTNVAIVNLTSPLILTNASFFGVTALYSNSITAASSPAFEPAGGEYSGLHITNSPSIAGQQCIGFPSTFKFDSVNRRIVIRDSVFWSDGVSDAGYFAETLSNPGVATNDLYFYNDVFHAGEYGCFVYGFWNTTFIGCHFDATVGFAPDQGPCTNTLIGCRFDAQAGVLSAPSNGKQAQGVLMQVRSRAVIEAGYFNITTTNAADVSAGVTFSGEGDYVTVIKNSHFHLAGPGTNTILDVRFNTSGSANTVVLDGVTWDGANGESGSANVVVQNLDPGGSNPTITVIGGNLTPANFGSLTGVTFQRAVDPIVYRTNLMAVANAPDFSIPVSLFSTNNVVQFQSCTNVDPSKTFYQECMVWVTNTTPATPRAIIAPVNCTTNGRALSIPFVTNLSQLIFRQYGQKFTNMECKPVF